MIKLVTLRNFKKFRDSAFEFHPHGITYLAGGNNSGKSTILQALAVWEFARAILVNERGLEAICQNYVGQGLGLSDDEFSPVLIASLKHLWTNLKTQIPGSDGYSLSICCEWDVDDAIKILSISLALTNDRLFIKCDNSNLLAGDHLPSIAYLPPFAGMSSRENRMTGAERRMMVGKGLAGGVIRNLLLDMYERNQAERIRLKEGRTKIKDSDLQNLRQSDPWEVLQKSLGDIFGAQLEVSPFNDLFHTNIKVQILRGTIDGYKFTKHVGYKARDLMSEGSGFLQWLSVYALALSGDNEVLLLDEPDAHLHPSLQQRLIESLYEFGKLSKKQVLLATHSTEILRSAEYGRVFEVKGLNGSYLSSPERKVGLFAGLGSEYAPKIDPLKRFRRLLLVEAKSDALMLQAWMASSGNQWPENIVVWPWTGTHKERKQLFIQLSQEVDGLRCISVRDRDDQSVNTTNKDTLFDQTMPVVGDDLKLRVWRRRHIENYCLLPAAIARAAKTDVDDVVQFFAEKALIVPANFGSRDVADPMVDARGKELMTDGDDSVLGRFGVRPINVAKVMTADEIPDDVMYILEQIRSLAE